jgi:3-dehydroquinate synthase
MVTGSQSMFDDFVVALEKGKLSDLELLNFIEQSLVVKQKVIEVDEYEKNIRRILNYGHTFGHALESLSYYEIPHGCAVAWGMDLANYISNQLGLLSDQDFAMIHRIFAMHFRFHLSQAVDPNKLIQSARRDKKVAQGKINLILLSSLGHLEIVPLPFDDQLEAWIVNYLEYDQVIDWS